MINRLVEDEERLARRLRPVCLVQFICIQVLLFGALEIVQLKLCSVVPNSNAVVTSLCFCCVEDFYSFGEFDVVFLFSFIIYLYGSRLMYSVKKT